LSNAELKGGKNNTTYAEIELASNIAGEPAMAIRGKNVLIAGNLHVGDTQDATLFYQGKTATFNNVVSGLSITTAKYNKVVSDWRVERATWEDVVRDLDIDFGEGKASWTNFTFEYPDEFYWTNNYFYALESPITWTNNTLVFKNGILV
jgi:hypothetical protein